MRAVCAVLRLLGSLRKLDMRECRAVCMHDATDFLGQMPVLEDLALHVRFLHLCALRCRKTESGDCGHRSRTYKPVCSNRRV